MEFLVQELNGKRPLLPPDLPMSPEVSRGDVASWAQTIDAVNRRCHFACVSHLLSWGSAHGTHVVLPTAPSQVEDVVGTFRMLAQLPSDSMGAYIISMSHTASDVLAVVLLQKECGGASLVVALICWDVGTRAWLLGCWHSGMHMLSAARTSRVMQDGLHPISMDRTVPGTHCCSYHPSCALLT